MFVFSPLGYKITGSDQPQQQSSNSSQPRFGISYPEPYVEKIESTPLIQKSDLQINEKKPEEASSFVENKLLVREDKSSGLLRVMAMSVVSVSIWFYLRRSDFSG